MTRLEAKLRRWSIAGLAVAVSTTIGIGGAQWALSDVNGYYMNPTDRGGPAYARARPVADDFWDRQARAYAADAVSTATSAQPAYLSASGS